MENLRNHTASWNSDKEIAALGTSVGRNPPGTIEPGTLAVYNAQGQLVCPLDFLLRWRACIANAFQQRQGGPVMLLP